ncbi:MAG: hypothetical protein ACKO01_07705 [Erythrobacter sp.]
MALVPLLMALCACGSAREDYPSLTMRPFEVAPETAPVAPPAPSRPATPEARIAELRAAASAADRAFSARQPDAARLARAAAGQPFESKARASALVAIADLDSKRAATAGALATLDRLAAEAAAALSPDPGVVAAQGDIAATLARQDAAIARLWEVMGS